MTHYAPHQLVVGTGQSVGKQRDHNEDLLFCMHSVLSDGELDLPFGIFIVADGMGGHQHGEIASSVAARTMADHLVKEVYQRVISPDKMPIESLHEIMDEGVRRAQQSVIKLAPGGGTTLTVALVLGERITLAHVGDSRAYLIKGDGALQAVTKDHSLVGRLIELDRSQKKKQRCIRSETFFTELWDSRNRLNPISIFKLFRVRSLNDLQRWTLGCCSRR